MSLGFDAISALPFATAQTAGDVLVQVSGNQLDINIGNFAISADSITEIPNPNILTLGSGTLTITADSNFTATGSQVTLTTGTPEVNVSVDITPSVNQLTLATGSVTISADCNIDVNSGLTTTQFAVDTGEVAAITWSEIVPGVDMVWTPIDTN
tara:strand:- start:113 stop:574 length:462 start_codon:yes stop_codon:yes gene_type:complete